MKIETRADVGLVAPVSRPRIPGPVLGDTAHHNGPAMRLLDRPHSACQAAWRGVQRFHMGRHHPNPNPNGRHWSDVAYTIAVCSHEIVMEGRGPGVRTAANGTQAGNDRWYATFFMLGGTEEPTRAHLVAARTYGIDVLGIRDVVPHSFHKATACPGQVHGAIRDRRFIIPDHEEDDEMLTPEQEATLHAVADATDRTVRAMSSLVEAEVARIREAVGLPPEPASDVIQRQRIMRGDYDLAEARRRLEAKAAGG